MHNPPSFIIAASHRQASQWLAKNPITDAPTILTQPSQFAGIYSPRVLCVSNYAQNRHWPALLIEFLRRDASLIYPDKLGEE